MVMGHDDRIVLFIGSVIDLTGHEHHGSRIRRDIAHQFRLMLHFRSFTVRSTPKADFSFPWPSTVRISKE